MNDLYENLLNHFGGDKKKVIKRQDFFKLEDKVAKVEELFKLKDKLNKDSKLFCTVFTPTYNRAYILPKLYESLKRQTDKDFEWVAKYLISEINGKLAA